MSWCVGNEIISARLTEIRCVHLVTQWKSEVSVKLCAISRWVEHWFIKQVREVAAKETLV